MHSKFKEVLGNYQLKDEKLVPVIKDMMCATFYDVAKDAIEEGEILEKNGVEIEKKLERIEERYVFEEINQVQYLKFKGKLEKELASITKQKEKCGLELSNLENKVDIALEYALNLDVLWEKADLKNKRIIQSMVFPEGIHYNRKNDDYRTIRTNIFFQLNPFIVR